MQYYAAIDTALSIYNIIYYIMYGRFRYISVLYIGIAKLWTVVIDILRRPLQAKGTVSQD